MQVGIEDCLQIAVLSTARSFNNPDFVLMLQRAQGFTLKDVIVREDLFPENQLFNFEFEYSVVRRTARLGLSLNPRSWILLSQ